MSLNDENDPSKAAVSALQTTASTLSSVPSRTTTSVSSMSGNTKTVNSASASKPASKPPPLEDDIKEIVSSLTRAQKLKLISGQSLWSLPQSPESNWTLSVADGPHGVRIPSLTPESTPPKAHTKPPPTKKDSRHELAWNSHPATCFPTAAALACTWDPDMARLVGQALADECRHYGISILLGPGMNLKRHASAGRNFEYWAEDPLLTSTLVSAYVQGVQEMDKTTKNTQPFVAACCKHYCCNNQETHRFVVDAVIDERSARELYLRQWHDVIRQSQPATIMCAYNLVNTEYCSEHEYLLNDMLRKEMGFDGIVMTDWGATNNRVAGIRAGLDLEMPGSHGAHDRAFKKALKKEKRKSCSSLQTALDASCERMIRLLRKLQPPEVLLEPSTVDWEEAHHEIAHRVALDCVVLLKNEDNLLPLQPSKQQSIAVIGDFARQHPRYQGMGSSQVAATRVATVYDRIQEIQREHANSDEENKKPLLYFSEGYHADDEHPTVIHQDLLDDAVMQAQKADVVVLCVGLPEIMESEGFDRPHLNMPGQHVALIHAVTAVNHNVVVILSNGGVLEMPWEHQVPAILEGYLLGQAGGAAMADLLFGRRSPCGKLAETFPLHKTDMLSDKYFPGITPTRTEHREGLDVGYRYFDSANLPVRFPFGHGLSYTTFEYSNLAIKVIEDEERQKHVEVTLELANTGSMAASEVVQCYVHDCKTTVYRPKQELRGFAKVFLECGETKTVSLSLLTDAFSFWDVGAEDWVVEPGAFEFRIGSSSRDIQLIETVEFQKGREATHLAQASYPPVKDEKGRYTTHVAVDLATFTKRFHKASGPWGRNLTLHEETPSSVIHRNSLLKDIAYRRLLGNVLLRVVFQAASKDVQPGPTKKRQRKMIRKNVESLPLRVLVLFSYGDMSFEHLDAMIAGMNFQYVKATRHVLGATKNMFAKK